MRVVSTIKLIAIAFACSALPSLAHAQGYPAKPVRLVTPTGAGGSLDTMARVLAQKLTEIWGQQAFVENRPGGGGMIGAGAVAKSSPDGYTLLVASNGNLATTQALYRNVPYDPVRDFAPIVLVAANPYVLVGHPSIPAKNVRELIRLARAKPGQINVASSGNGSTPHLALELLKSMAGVRMLHVPYKTSSAGLTSVVSGETSLMFTGVVSGLPFVTNGRLRAIAVASDKRLSILPAVPTIAEDGVPGYEASNWAGMLAPAGTPAAVIDAVHAGVMKLLQMPDVRENFRKQGLEVLGGTPDEFGRFIRSEIAKWTKVVRESGAKVD
ncbi:MAG: tripartite tricarboxylate transporter substrate binding protein [Betaproteobacteria bacterium]|nr:tripartite tricarboxylate transporter substrate binding protein [Betaproteobacteria bacterium]